MPRLYQAVLFALGVSAILPTNPPASNQLTVTTVATQGTPNPGRVWDIATIAIMAQLDAITTFSPSTNAISGASAIVFASGNPISDPIALTPTGPSTNPIAGQTLQNVGGSANLSQPIRLYHGDSLQIVFTFTVTPSGAGPGSVVGAGSGIITVSGANQAAP